MSGFPSAQAAINAAIAAEQARANAAYATLAPAPNGTDDTAAITAYINAVHAATTGRFVQFQAGVYKFTAALPAYSNMTYQGAGAGAGRTKMSWSGAGSMHGFYDAEGATANAPMTDVTWKHLEVDGSGVGGASSKAFFIQHMLRPKWVDVNAHHWPATAFGCDYLVDYLFGFCRADNNGRLGAIDDAGMSGFGIGTGEYAVENGTMFACGGSGNKNFGAFWEQQNVANGGSPFYSKGVKVSLCDFRGNTYGLGDAGLRGLKVDLSDLSANTRDGFTSCQGTGGGIGAPGIEGLVTTTTMDGNGRYGAFLDYRYKSQLSAAAKYQIKNNASISGSGVAGVQISVGTTYDVSGIQVTDNPISLSGANGIQAASLGAALIDPDLSRNRVDGSGQTDLTYTQAIRLAVNTTRLTMLENKCWDPYTPQKQTYGLYTDAGFTHTDANIRRNQLRGNLTGAASFLGTFAGATFTMDNPGFNPILGQTSLGLSGAGPYTHTAGNAPELFEVSGGTGVSITRLGANCGSSGQVLLQPRDTLTIAWATAPTTAYVTKL